MSAELESSCKETHVSQHFKLRTYQRIPLCACGYYLSENFLGKGTIRDISPGGWQLQGDHQVEIGMILSLRVEFPGNIPALEVARASVQWVRGQHFGVQIDRISKQAAKRLELLISAHRQDTHPVRR